jgi:hypothetical protein
MADLTILDMSTSLDNFKPIHIPDGFARVRNRRADRFLDACFRRANNFEYFVDVIFHFILACRWFEPRRLPKNNATRFKIDARR